MIEVEKKFLVEDGQAERITAGAEYIGEKTFTDTYFDTNDHQLTRADKWLRERDGKFELKLPMFGGREKTVDQYDELTEEAAIRHELELAYRSSMTEDLMEAGYQPFATLVTTRRKYRKDDFVIDLDEIDFGESQYRIGEIEKLIDGPEGTQAAIDEILAFAQANGLEIAQVRGKVVEYLKRYRPEHFQALVEAGVIREG